MAGLSPNVGPRSGKSAGNQSDRPCRRPNLSLNYQTPCPKKEDRMARVTVHDRAATPVWLFTYDRCRRGGPLPTNANRLMRTNALGDPVRTYDPDTEESVLKKAYVFAMQAHGPQRRASGDPYFSHPLEVAGILTDLKLDTATIATALLHDTVEDTTATIEDIEGNFGPEIAGLVDGVTKLSQLELFSERTKQAENLPKLMLAISNDIRVLLVKLADRLHNMLTLPPLK